MQSRKQSATEAVMNVLIGYTINFIANMTLFPLFGWQISIEQNLWLGTIYTVISLVRSYGLRRFYNWYHK